MEGRIGEPLRGSPLTCGFLREAGRACANPETAGKKSSQQGRGERTGSDASPLRPEPPAAARRQSGPAPSKLSAGRALQARSGFQLWQFGSFVHVYKWKKAFSNCHQNPPCRFCRQYQCIYLRKQKKLPKLSYYVRTKASKPRLFMPVKTLLQPKASIHVRYNRTAL